MYGEMLDVVDEEGNPTGEVVEREKAHAEGICHRTAHLWLVRENEGQVEILLQKRSNDKDSFPGCYDISSAGHIPAGDDYVVSALRELKEELGIDAKPEELIFCGRRRIRYSEAFYGKPFVDNQVTNVYLMWKNIPEEEFLVQKEEIESVQWIPFRECMEKVEQNPYPDCKLFPNCIMMEELLMLEKAIF